MRPQTWVQFTRHRKAICVPCAFANRSRETCLNIYENLAMRLRVATRPAAIRMKVQRR